MVVWKWNTGSIIATTPHTHSLSSPVAADTPLAPTHPRCRAPLTTGRIPCSLPRHQAPRPDTSAPPRVRFLRGRSSGHWGAGRSGSSGRVPLAFLCVTARSRSPPPTLLVLRCGAQPRRGEEARVLCSCATTATTPAARPAASSRCVRVR